METVSPLKINNILDVTDNSIIVLRSPDKYNNDFLKLVETLVHKLGKTYKNIFMILLDNEQSLETISEEQMNKAGWYKK